MVAYICTYIRSCKTALVDSYLRPESEAWVMALNAIVNGVSTVSAMRNCVTVSGRAEYLSAMLY